MTQYFEKYRGAERVSLVNALTEMGESASYNYRTRIAAANNIANYTGTATQNLQMLSLLKSGDLIRPADGAAADSTEQPKSNRKWLFGMALAGTIGALFFGKKKMTDKKPRKKKKRKKASK